MAAQQVTATASGEGGGDNFTTIEGVLRIAAVRRLLTNMSQLLAIGLGLKKRIKDGGSPSQARRGAHALLRIEMKVSAPLLEAEGSRKQGRSSMGNAGSLGYSRGGRPRFARPAPLLTPVTTLPLIWVQVPDPADQRRAPPEPCRPG
jgi:hypothetical protein